MQAAELQNVLDGTGMSLRAARVQVAFRARSPPVPESRSSLTSKANLSPKITRQPRDADRAMTHLDRLGRACRAHVAYRSGSDVLGRGEAMQLASTRGGSAVPYLLGRVRCLPS